MSRRVRFFILYKVKFYLWWNPEETLSLFCSMLLISLQIYCFSFGLWYYYTSILTSLAFWLIILLALLATVAYSSNYCWCNAYLFIVSSSLIWLKDSGSNMKEFYSLEIALRIFFKALSFCKSFSTSNTVTRYSIASERFLTRVHDLGSLNRLFYLEGKYIDSSSELYHSVSLSPHQIL